MSITFVVQPPVVATIADPNGFVSSGIDQPTSDLVTRVNAIPVTAKDMCLAAVEIQERLRKGCTREMRLRCLTQVFDGRRDQVVALNFRLEAMGRMVRSGQLRPWVLPNIVRDIVFVAASKAPILCADKQWHFDETAFVTSVLELEHIYGHA